MFFQDVLNTLPKRNIVIAIQCQHDTDVDEVCCVGRGSNVSNLQYCYDYIVDQIEYVPHIKTLSKNSAKEYVVNDYKEGGYVIYIRPEECEPKTFYLKGINYIPKNI